MVCLNQFTHTKSPLCIDRDGNSANVCENSIKKHWRTFKTKPMPQLLESNMRS